MVAILSSPFISEEHCSPHFVETSGSSQLGFQNATGMGLANESPKSSLQQDV